jgi:hypothetical protein
MYKQRYTECNSLQRGSCAEEKECLLRPHGCILGTHNCAGLQREEGGGQKKSHQMKKTLQNWSFDPAFF